MQQLYEAAAAAGGGWRPAGCRSATARRSRDGRRTAGRGEGSSRPARVLPVRCDGAVSSGTADRSCDGAASRRPAPPTAHRPPPPDTRQRRSSADILAYGSQQRTAGAARGFRGLQRLQGVSEGMRTGGD